jgi:hypothetical protein
VKGDHPALYLAEPGCYRCLLAVGHSGWPFDVYRSVFLTTTGTPIHQYFERVASAPWPTSSHRSSATAKTRFGLPVTRRPNPS